MSSRLVTVLALLCLAGCSQDPGIVVDLRTNLLAGVDFQEARFHVEGAESATEAELHTVRRPVNTSDGRDIRLGEVVPLPVGRYTVIVELWTSFETRVATNRVSVTVDRLTAVTVLITADCAGVVCPGVGDSPESTYCLAARCVPQECRDDPTAPGCPEPECTSDGDCSAVAACAQGRCTGGACYVEPLDERCGSGATCHIERGCIEAPMDAGGTCTPGACDDGNPCTDDVCGAMGCEHTANSGPCDDGMFCNGADTCSGGTCAAHAGSPCGGEMCSEGAQTCAACLSDADCPADSMGMFTACVFDDVCDETGTRSRDLTTWACDTGACRPTVTPQPEACTRDTDGVGCGMDVPGAWGACDYADLCDESATRSRTVTRYACAAGACASSAVPEMEPCTRDTDGTMCAPDDTAPWGACDYSDVCDQSASRSRDVTRHSCAAGSCRGTTSPESEPCSRSTNGTTCGTTTYGGWGVCGYTSVCDQDATRSRSVTMFSCQTGTCRSIGGSESEGCSRSTDGLDCDDGAYCNGDDTCGGGSCTHAGDPCGGGTVCDEPNDTCWDYGDDGTNCYAAGYYNVGGSLPPPPAGYSHYSPPVGCDYEGCTAMFCQANYCMPCPGGNCALCL
ncbi:MAG: hypothetical protein H6719_32985 [Sandaracinaceae bacterium]|nr:hypothetical protein [Sandaracinaceae bacterium]